MSLNVTVVAADREIWKGIARQVSAKTSEGEIGILSGHEPVLAILSRGEVRVSGESGEQIVVDAADGFLSVDHDTVTVVAGKAAVVS